MQVLVRLISILSNIHFEIMCLSYNMVSSLVVDVKVALMQQIRVHIIVMDYYSDVHLFLKHDHSLFLNSSRCFS